MINEGGKKRKEKKVPSQSARPALQQPISEKKSKGHG